MEFKNSCFQKKFIDITDDVSKESMHFKHTEIFWVTLKKKEEEEEKLKRKKEKKFFKKGKTRKIKKKKILCSQTSVLIVKFMMNEE